MTKQKFYAVRSGIQPGIYHTWDDCKKQTSGVSGAVFKSFSTQEAADHFLKAAPTVCKQHTSGHSKQLAEAAASQAQSSRDPAQRPCSETSQPAAPSDADPHAALDAAPAGGAFTDSQPAAAPWMDSTLTYRLVLMSQVLVQGVHTPKSLRTNGLQEFDGASRGNPGPAGAGAVLMEHATDKQVWLHVHLLDIANDAFVAMAS